MNIFEIIGAIILGVLFVLSVVGVIIEKIRTGHWWEGQGFGKK